MPTIGPAELILILGIALIGLGPNCRRTSTASASTS
jgi:Sec-independent protein translocase protein TatA